MEQLSLHSQYYDAVHLSPPDALEKTTSFHEEQNTSQSSHFGSPKRSMWDQIHWGKLEHKLHLPQTFNKFT